MNGAEVENHALHVLGLHLVRNTYVHQERNQVPTPAKKRWNCQAVNIVNNPSGFSGAMRMYIKICP